MSARTLTADLRMWRHSGIGRYLRNLWPLLLPRLDFERIRVLAPGHLMEQITAVRDARVVAVPFEAAIYSPAEQIAALRGLYRNAGLVWVPHYNVPLAHRGPLVVTIHDLAPLVLPEALGSALKRAYAGVLTRRAAKQASAVLTVSHFTASELHRVLGVDPAKVTVTPLGLDTGWCGGAVRPHAEPDGAAYVLFVGNVKPNKNLGLLLRAALLGGSWRVLIAGKVSGFETADETVHALARKLGDRVRFAGEVSDGELRSLYAGALALCMPSLYEGFGLPVLEGMAAGCPVVCSSATSLPEVAGDAALYVDPYAEDAAAQLSESLRQVADPQTRTQLIGRGLAQSAKFSFASCAQSTAEVLNRVAEARGMR